jgi:hypothetical protein
MPPLLGPDHRSREKIVELLVSPTRLGNDVRSRISLSDVGGDLGRGFDLESPALARMRHRHGDKENSR